LTIVGSWTGAILYDRREKKRIQQKWCDAVSHLRSEPLSPMMLRRKLLIVLAAPPADGLLSAREHFHEYIRPILVAGGLDWEAIEGRKEGEIRAQVAERIRDLRRRQGEVGGESTEEEKEVILQETRERLGVTPEPTVQGDIIIGRHTWKEYIRGLHEGWLGPLAQPPELISTDEKPAASESRAKSLENPAGKLVENENSRESESLESPLSDLVDDTRSEEAQESSDSHKRDEQIEGEEPQNPEESKDPPKSEVKKRKQLPPFINTDSYSSSSLPSTFNSDLGPSVTVPFPHILGFFNTPIRMYRFLTRRYLAEDIGKQVAAAVLATYTPYTQVEREVNESNSQTSSESRPISRLVWEQEVLLENEVSDWHKSVSKREESDDKKERVWLDPVILDDRIASRMRKFVQPDNSKYWENRDP
jgi:mitochondrial import inner membrane translocase subunit TIM54